MFRTETLWKFKSDFNFGCDTTEKNQITIVHENSKNAKRTVSWFEQLGLTENTIFLIEDDRFRFTEIVLEPNPDFSSTIFRITGETTPEISPETKTSSIELTGETTPETANSPIKPTGETTLESLKRTIISPYGDYYGNSDEPEIDDIGSDTYNYYRKRRSDQGVKISF